MDTFFEQIVKKKKSGMEWFIAVGVWLLALVLILAVWLFLPILVLPLALALGFGAWWLSTAQNKEYEYSVTNGDIDIDLIVAKRKRTRLVSVSGRKIECLLPYDPSQVSANGFQRVLTLTPSAAESGMWYFVYNSKKNGRTLVVFSPEQRVLGALYAGLQKLVQLDTQRAMRELGIDVSEFIRKSGHGS